MKARLCLCLFQSTAVFTPSVCTVQGADRALAFCSGMAALSAVLRLVASGEHVVAGDDLYGGTSRLLAQVGFESHRSLQMIVKGPLWTDCN